MSVHVWTRCACAGAVLVWAQAPVLAHMSAWAQTTPTAAPASSPAQPKPSPTSTRPTNQPKTQPPAAAPASAPPAAPSTPAAALAVSFPHPLIAEVLYAVPTGIGGDANQDGTRRVAGDEFIELVNPHDKPIQLGGYVLSDATAATGKGGFRFVFPPMELAPHSVVVVFNGHESTIPGPVGDTKVAPATGNSKFHNAKVLSAKMTSSRASLSNTGDAVTLRGPSPRQGQPGAPVQRIRWGKADASAGGTTFPLDEVAPTTSKASVEREGLGPADPWRVHAAHDGGTPFSPGLFVFPEAPAPGTPAPSPAPSSTPTTPTTQPASSPQPASPTAPAPADPRPSQHP